jgi:hypothetical protein
VCASEPLRGAYWTCQSKKTPLLSHAAICKEDREQVRRLILFFSVVYVAEGIGQFVGPIAQPLNYFLKEVHGWTPVQISAYLAVFHLPWIIKPVY